MKKAEQIIQKGIVSFDADAVKAETIKIDKVVRSIDSQDISYELWYKKCISPMFLSRKQYKRLKEGKIVELHEAQTFILFKD